VRQRQGELDGEAVAPSGQPPARAGGNPHIDLLRRRLGERRIAYFGQSYGTYLGATYAKLFPRRYRAMVLDAPLDPDAYARRPLDDAVAGAGGFEDSLDRFFAACAADQATCRFGSADPRDAFDALVAQLDRRPAPAGDARPADGGDVLAAAFEALSVKAWWVRLAHALAAAAAGDGTGLRALADARQGAPAHAARRRAHRLPGQLAVRRRRDRHVLPARPATRAGNGLRSGGDVQLRSARSRDSASSTSAGETISGGRKRSVDGPVALMIRR